MVLLSFIHIELHCMETDSADLHIKSNMFFVFLSYQVFDHTGVLLRNPYRTVYYKNVSLKQNGHVDIGREYPPPRMYFFTV